MATFTTSLKSKLIYVFAIDDERHRDCLKIGETTIDEDDGSNLFNNTEALQEAAHKRIRQYTKTAGIAYQLLHTEISIYVQSGMIMTFNDKQVHKVLERSGIRKKEFAGVKGADEWYCCDLETVKKAILAVKKGETSLHASDITTGQTPILFRPEQREAIDRTRTRFKKGNQMLWNAKMRFGKTLSALQVVKEEEFTRTLILTHRPVVDAGWFEDFGKIFYDRKDYRYGSRTNGEDFSSLERMVPQGKKYIYFASMQDLRGSETVGGKFDKNDRVFTTPWDFIIVDEAHEGTKTELGQNVLKELRKDTTKVLQLSGTPFNLFDDYSEEEIYTWDYVMEQKAKQAWYTDNPYEPNPYASLPAINIYTYDLGNLMSEFVEEEKAFNFREFFRTKDDGTFVHDRDVDKFLNLMCKDDAESLYPYSNDEYRRIFRHTLWMVPGVKAAKALSTKLKSHPVFGAFEVVNVAGDGDEEEESIEALKAVEKAIGKDPDKTYTITLSCGRLTTGVSVKPWTGVFMMAGSFSTSAAGYMQTIFRVQTPYSHNGRMKEQCYAFDFAPDRTLRVLAETAKVSAKAGKTTDGDRKILGDFLNFCPIISIEGSQMKPYDVKTMMGQLKRAQIEKVVQCGFEDGALYNDELLKLTDVELELFKHLKGKIGATKAMAKSGDIDVNQQGFTNEEYAEKEKLEKKKKKDLTPEEKARLEELKQKKTQRAEAISILRGISIRMPLLIYGAELKNEEEELTINNFTNLVDDVSWEEFMPKGVTKEDFENFKKYYEADVFREAGKRIRAMARAADKFTIEERIERLANIFNTFRNPDKETVLTPWRVVNMHMSDCLGGWCFYDEDFKQPLSEPRFVDRGQVTKDVFKTDAHVLEINSKSGLYPLYCAYNIYRARVEAAKEKYGEVSHSFAMSLWDATIEENILVVCKTPMARSITRRTLAGFRGTRVNAQYYKDLIKNISEKPTAVVNTFRDGKHFWKINNNENMKIDAVVGNPPYQEEGISTRKSPIYHLFYNLAFNVSKKVSLITPGRFLYKAGQTPEEWMNKMLTDEHFKVITYFPQSTDVFPTVDIKGGVAITYRDADQNFGEIKFFSPYKQLTNIYQKVISHKDFIAERFSDIVSSQGIYRFTESVLKDFPEIEMVQGKGTALKITSNVFEHLPNLFTEEGNNDDSIQILGRSKGTRIYKWIKKKYIQVNNYWGKYNVLVPEANGTGNIGEVLSAPIVCMPMVGHTDTFISIGRFDTRLEAEACLKYIKTKFARTMLGTLKATQHNPKDTWANIPLQNFTKDSDINWNADISAIDAELYAKYRLSDEEIQFIESMIKPME
ncbi:MAG: Eco57I restriction-modification methylase domain-containing protein [Bacteroidales bacterium]|nr:Eco57I restriction-modification methylase domain-containing protein [Bacteroidales bacterium]